jgi:Ca-activated chloride channel family protein
VRALTLALLWAGGLAFTHAQLPFRSDISAVPVYATVTDAEGSLVTDLRIDDFEIQDNGRKQPITTFANGPQPLSVAILLDNSPSLFGVSDRAQKAVLAFAHDLAATDRACLGTFSHVVTLNPELTSNPDALVKHLGDDAPFPAGTALWDAIDAGRTVLASVAGRRVVLVVTDAVDNSSRANIDAVRAGLLQDGVMVYAIGMHGREGLQRGDISAIARVTGGAYIELNPNVDVEAFMKRIADELHHQFVLGFAPVALDDKLHRIDVRIRRAGYSVRARRSYVASSHAPIR